MSASLPCDCGRITSYPEVIPGIGFVAGFSETEGVGTETTRQTFLNGAYFCSAKVMPVSHDLDGACAIFGSRLRVLDSDCSYRAAGDGGKVFLCGIVLPVRFRSE